MLRTLLLLAMAYGVRRNEANGDCPGFKGNGVCEWGATRQSDGRGLARDGGSAGRLWYGGAETAPRVLLAGKGTCLGYD